MYATDNTTFINGLGIAFVLLMGVLMLVLPRRYALLPVVAMVCFMTMGQRVLVLNLNFTLIRILLVFGLLRVIVRGEIRAGSFNGIDRAMVWWVLASIVANTMLWKTSEAFVNRLGLAYDALGLYFIFRVLVRDVDDMRCVVRQFAWAVVPLALSMLVERNVGRNPFAVLGGVPPETLLREGVLRCQGPFSHPILAGAFGSAALPLFIGMWWQPRGRIAAVLGTVSAFTIVVLSGSSGPLMAAVIGVLALGAWPLRRHMRAVRWTLGLSLLALHLAMAAPVWFLLARVGIFGGSTGYHRAILIDHAVSHFPEWWWVGTQSTADWGYYMFDVTNQYVLIGVQGGVGSLLLFLLIIKRAFASSGDAVHASGHGENVDHKMCWMAWALGASLLVHCVNYISVPYFDQNIVCWYLLLAMIATAGQVARRAAPSHAASTAHKNHGAAPAQGLPPPGASVTDSASPVPTVAPGLNPAT